MSARLQIALWTFAPPVLACALFLAWFASGTLDATGHDFWVFMQAGRKLAQDPGSLYEWAQEGSRSYHVYLYPPLFAVLFVPFSWLETHSAFCLWNCISLIAFWVALVWLGRSLGLADHDLPRWAGLTTLLLIGSLFLDLEAGQINRALFAILAVGLALLRGGRPAAAGLVFAFAAHFKALPCAILLVLVVFRQWRAAAAMTGGLFAGLALCGAALVPSQGLLGGLAMTVTLHVDYVASLVMPSIASAQNTTVLSESSFNMSLPLAVKSWADMVIEGGVRWARHAGILLGGVMFAVSLWVANRSSHASRHVLGIGLAYAAVTVSNITCWAWHLPVLALVIGPALRMQSVRRDVLLAMFGLGALLISIPSALLMNPQTFDLAFGMASARVPTLGVLLTWLAGCLALWRTRDAALSVPAVQVTETAPVQ